jgi:hypothetical protein
LGLPLELRQRVYETVLYTGQAIQPHLCDRKGNGAIKFHDDSQHSRTKPNHVAINKLLSITLVSKQVRAESLPCFYSINTFSVGSDTATYFAHLDQINRFHMIRHVSFSIPLLRTEWTTQVLEQMMTYLGKVKAYEGASVPPRALPRVFPQALPRDLPWALPRAVTLTEEMYALGLVSHSDVHTHPDVYKRLVEHPRHLAGGLNEMALFICMRMLTSTFTSPSKNYNTQLVLPVPSADIFANHPHLRWFSSVSHGLGIHLRFLEDHELDYLQSGSVGLTWHQKYQKTDFQQEGNADEKTVRKRTQQMFPEPQEGKFWTNCSYMRTSCDGRKYEWFKVQH